MDNEGGSLLFSSAYSHQAEQDGIDLLFPKESKVDSVMIRVKSLLRANLWHGADSVSCKPFASQREEADGNPYCI